MNENNTNKRARNWCAVIYPESAPADWKDQLNKLNVKWACSPLHDKDVDDDGQLKKAHWHIVICYSGNKSYSQVIDDLQVCNCPRPQICRDVTSSLRYFIHKDHPHKYQYDKKDIEAFGGFELDKVFNLSRSEKLELLTEILLYIRDNDIKEYFDLVNYAMDVRYDDWLPLITEGYTIMIREYIKSNRHRHRICNEETGEIIG